MASKMREDVHAVARSLGDEGPHHVVRVVPIAQ
jgi:hypothetical protein